MKKVCYDTYRTRIKLGWCDDRARKAVPIPTTVGISEYADSSDFLYLDSIRRIRNQKQRHYYRVTCVCGKQMDLCNEQLLFDVHCGCQTGGTSPTVLNWLKMLEEDEDYINFCKENETVPTCAGWFKFRHF